MTPAQMTEPGSIILTKDESDSVIDAIDELANDLAYLGREDERTAARADALSQLSDRLRERAGIEVNRS